MLFRQAIRKTFSGVRHQSTIARAQERASDFVSGLSSKFSKSVYWTKVSAEIAKQVWLKEKLSPPSLHEIQSVYQTLYTQGFYYAQRPTEFLSILKSIDKNVIVNSTAYLIQFAGLFALGEAIGRRKLVGYPSFESHSH
ncbi:CYFA0S13e03774g1_1 [Cyberlindnera fabianii]|uniref:CYFA0S13e03774g1_1 n=1 Tax=Cyberlindnera fabianii TaxID=36022 RepID=A0A061B2U1_CYBFA|nr:CYFA0S13e03774g1_1 [Cyberlindnera fabianii]